MTRFNSLHIEQLVVSRMAKKMDQLGKKLVGEVKRGISIRNYKGRNPSMAGEMPHLVTGTLRNHISHQVKTISNKVWLSLGVLQGWVDKYAFKLEFEKDRSFLLATMVKEKALIKQALNIN